MNTPEAPTGMAAPAQEEVLQSLLQTSIELSSSGDRTELLDRILTKSRRLTGAQAASLYVRADGCLEFAVAQNDAIDVTELARTFVGRRLSVDMRSLAGFVASTGELLNIPDSHCLPIGSPFRINRDFDAASGYRTVSILAVPLKCPDGEVVGVLELINRVGEDGRPISFPQDESPAVLSMASLAAVSVHNALLAEQVHKAHLDTIMRLSVAAEYRDKGTAEHIRRISGVSARIAAAVGMDNGEVELVRLASPMHDVGKIAIPDSILLKPGPLTADERRIVETHCIIGAQILANPSNPLMAMARDIALGHHERWDATGYPHRLGRERIPLAARIVAMADVFDALCSKRCYKEAYPMDEVVEIIRSEVGRHFGPTVAGAFFDAFDDISAPYPAGKAARLT